MKTDIIYPDIFSLEKDVVFVDLRTKREYNRATIPGAVSLPILNEEERKNVSILYNEGEHNKAKLLGIDYVSEKLPLIFEYVDFLQKDRQVVFFCDRGGYRSTVITDIFTHLNIPVMRLRTGYKGYRRYIHEHLNGLIKEKNYIVIRSGLGGGREKVLRALQSEGEDVINLRDLANSNPFSTGNVQPSQKVFESLLAEKLMATGDTVFIGDVPAKLGKIHISKILRRKLAEGKIVDLDPSTDRRVKNLTEAGAAMSDEELLALTEEFSVRDDKRKELEEFLERDRRDLFFEEFIRRSDHKRKKREDGDLVFRDESFDTVIEELKKYKNEKDLKKKILERHET